MLQFFIVVAVVERSFESTHSMLSASCSSQCWTSVLYPYRYAGASGASSVDGSNTSQPLSQ